MKKSIKLTAATAVAALALGTGVAAFAADVQGGTTGSQNGTPRQIGPMGGGPMGGHHDGEGGDDDGDMRMGMGPRDGGIDGVSAVLAELVKAGTITQAQSDAITKALANAPAAAQAAAEARKAAHEKLVSDTIGVAWADIQTRLKAGETLAAIAGAKKDALVAALVKEETDRIAADVAAGRLTEAQATERKTGLTERITAEISSVHKAPEAKGVMGPMGKKGIKGKGGPMGPKPAASPSASTSSTTTSSAKSKGKVVVKQVKTVTTKKSA